MKRAVFLKTALSALALSATLPVLAQEAYPSKPIRFVVPYPPGGPTDLMARLLQPELQTRLGVTVVVDNKSGAGGNLGSAEVAKQLPADGYALLLAASGPMAVNPSLYKSMAFDPLKDLAPVIQISSFPLVLEVSTKLGVKTPQELAALAKRPDSKLTFASAGNGTPQHLAGEIFNTQMGISLSHIPYRGAGPALNDMIGGQVSVMFDVLGSSLPHIQGGRLVPLAVTSAQRHPSLPNVPTMMEAGIAGYEFTAWHGIAVRAGTPAPIVAKLNSTLNAIFSDAEFKKKWEAIGTPVVGGTPQQFGDLIRKDSVRLGEVVKRAGVTVD
ncbi:MAG: Bug family tripartite tricarboxylate transporter substrate binding protein [Hydrogenophaga sp.]|uniref:Bug family tripartite tricarboxylate transporter substrate binding protein n=1 Tax=Hydrogenophaga sp. TaxID=1904254 RepID=UPI003D9AFBB8